MKTRHRQQAEQLYQALLRRQQTWTRSIDDWAIQFAELESDIGSKSRIQKVLDWFCTEGCGAVFVPLIGTAESFRQKVEQIDAARIRLKGQTLSYFDDVVPFKILERKTGSVAQKQYSRCVQKLQQTVEFIDALANGRAKLPKVKATLQTEPSTNGHSSNGKLTKTEKATLQKWVLVSRDTIWELMMDNPINQAEYFSRIRPALRRYVRQLNQEINHDPVTIA